MKNNSAKKQNITESIYSFLGTLLLCMICVFVAFIFFFRVAEVSGNSMNPGLKSGDKIVVSNFLYKPDYSDIIAIGRGGLEDDSIIKRIIALGGDEVVINFETHLITVNGKVIPEAYEVMDALTLQGDIVYPVTVPDGHVFVLGDNRNNSLDSRFSEIGFIDEREIAGRALFRLFPFGNTKIK